MDLREYDAVRTPKKREPVCVGDVRRLMGFLGCYRRYIQNFSRKAQLLYNLMKIDTTSSEYKSSKRKKRGSKAGQATSSQAVQQTEEHQGVSMD